MTDRVWTNGPGVWTNGAGEVIAQEPGPARVGSEREGWRARLAHVERILDQSIGYYIANHNGHGIAPLEEALAEVRSMIDGDT